MADEELARNHSKGFFSNPLVGIIGSIASVVSLILAVYFYVGGKQFPELTYFVNPAKAIVMKAGQSSRLTASYDNKIIDSDITATQIAIWNNGKTSIRQNSILKPLIIYTADGTPILEATIRKVSRDVANIKLQTNELQKGRLVVSWDILEQNDGGIIQLIYAGSPDINILAEGVIEGQKEIKRVEIDHKSQPEEGNWFATKPYRTMGYGALTGALFGTALITIGTLIGRRRRSLVPPHWFEITVVLFFFALAFYCFFIAKEPGPPFTF